MTPEYTLLILLLFGNLGDPCKEALLIGLRIELITEVGEIQLERGIGDDEIEFLELTSSIFPVVGLQNGIPLDDVRDGVDEVIQNEIEPQEAGGFLRNVLCVDGAAVLADRMSQVHQEGS